MKKLPVLFILCAMAVPGLTSCSEKLCRVKQYERGVLAKSIMADAPDPLLAAMTEHAYFSREASSGGAGVGGGGCGCN
jgi:hypothetical protein